MAIVAPVMGALIVLAYLVWVWMGNRREKRERARRLEAQPLGGVHTGTLRALPPAAEPMGSRPTGARRDEALQLRTTLVMHEVEPGPMRLLRDEEGGAIYGFRVRGEEALVIWERLRSLVKKTNRLPLVVAWSDGRLVDLWDESVTAATSIREASDLDAAAWLEERAEGDPEYYGALEEGTWGSVEPQREFVVPFDLLTGKPRDDIHILLIPTTVPWEICAWMRYGDWNECPPPRVHVAMQRAWYETYGAELVTMSGDILEFRVARPPTTKEDALPLARQQFLYSGGDLVYQGYDSLRALAGSLIRGKTWFFWWD